MKIHSEMPRACGVLGDDAQQILSGCSRGLVKAVSEMNRHCPKGSKPLRLIGGDLSHTVLPERPPGGAREPGLMTGPAEQ